MRPHTSACIIFNAVTRAVAGRRSSIRPARTLALPFAMSAALNLALCLTLGLALNLFHAAPAAAKVVDRIVASVNGEVITLYELNSKLKPMLAQMQRQGIPPQNEEAIAQLRSKLLTGIVEDILVVQEAEKYKVTVSEIELDNYINRIKESNQLDEDKFTEFLTSQGLTKQDFKNKIRNDMLKHRILGYMVKRKIVITDEDIQQYYEEHKTDFMGQRTVGLSLIVLPPGDDATGIVEKIRSGDLSFEAAAAEHSIGPGAESGGDIGVLKWTSLAPDWKAALEGLHADDVSDPFVLEGQQAILKVVSMTDGTAKPIEEVREEITDKIREPLLEERYAEYMDKLKEKAVIDIRL